MSEGFHERDWIDVSRFFSDGANGVRTYVPRDPRKRAKPDGQDTEERLGPKDEHAVPKGNAP